MKSTGFQQVTDILIICRFYGASEGNMLYKRVKLRKNNEVIWYIFVLFCSSMVTINKIKIKRKFYVSVFACVSSNLPNFPQ